MRINEFIKYTSIRLYIVCIVLTFSFSLNVLGSNMNIDSLDLFLLHPNDIIGKHIIFSKPTETYVGDCFYSEEAFIHNKYSKKFRFLANDNGETPTTEYLDCVFNVLDIIFLNPKTNLISDGFVLKLQREDGAIIGLKFNKFNPDKKYARKSCPSFSELFIRSKIVKEYSKILSYHIGVDKVYSTDIQIKAINVDCVNRFIKSLTEEYKDTIQIVSNMREIDNYVLDSISYKSECVKIFIKRNGDNICVTPSQLQAIYTKRNQDIAYNRLMQKWISKYNQDELLYIKERLIGKELWVYGSIINYYFFEKPIGSNSKKSNYVLWSETNRERSWLSPYSEIYGSSVTEFETMFFNTMNDYYAKSCIIEDMIISENCLPGKARDVKYYKGRTHIDNDFCLYLVVKQNPNKEYLTSKSTNMNDTNSRIYVLVENGISEKFISDVDNQLNLEQCKLIEKGMIDEMNERFTNVYIVANKLWGENIAKLIQSREVRFGFSVDMCLMAYRDCPYRISKISTPFGLATCYNFFEKEVKLFFINEELIGIQFKLEDIRYYKNV